MRCSHEGEQVDQRDASVTSRNAVRADRRIDVREAGELLRCHVVLSSVEGAKRELRARGCRGRLATGGPIESDNREEGERK